MVTISAESTAYSPTAQPRNPTAVIQVSMPPCLRRQAATLGAGLTLAADQAAMGAGSTQTPLGISPGTAHSATSKFTSSATT